MKIPDPDFRIFDILFIKISHYNMKEIKYFKLLENKIRLNALIHSILYSPDAFAKKNK